MKSSFATLLFLVIIFSFSSCKQKEKTCKLGKYYVSDASNTPPPNVFSYYSDGRLQRIIYSNGSKDTLFYRSDTLHLLSFDERDSLSFEFTGNLNSNGDVLMGVKTQYDYLGSIMQVDNYNMQYNASGNLVQQSVSNTNGVITTTYNYEEGNRISGKLFSGAVLQKQYLFFHSKADNKTELDDDSGVFTPYFGRPSKKLLDSLLVITGGDTAKIIYSHSLDANSYVTKTVRAQLPPTVDTKYYTYAYFDCRE